MPKTTTPKPYFLLGLIAALSLTWAALEWTRFEWSTARAAAAFGVPSSVLETEWVPASVPVKPPPPPSPIHPLVEPGPEPDPLPPGPPTPPPNPQFFGDWDGLIGPKPDPGFGEEIETLLVADHMPAFAECVQILDPEAERNCTEKQIISHMQSCVEFPRQMKEIGLDGVVYLQYVIDENGQVRDATILRSPHSAFEATTLACIEGLPVMQPGKQQGRTVRVQYTLPVRFSLH